MTRVTTPVGICQIYDSVVSDCVGGSEDECVSTATACHTDRTTGDGLKSVASHEGKQSS